MAGVWLGRVPIAETAARSFCSDHDLDCNLEITRLDFGGVTLRNIRISGDSAEPAVVADRFALDFEWAGPFAARPAWIGGGDITVRLNATGQGPLLGDLDETFASLTEGRTSQTGGKMPRLDIQKIRVVAATMLGPVEASGHIRSTGEDVFDISIVAPATRLSGPLGQMDFTGASLVAKRAGADLDGRLRLNLARFDSPVAKAENIRVDLDLDQAKGLFTASGSIIADHFGSRDTQLNSFSARVALRSDALDLAVLRPASLYDGLQSFTADIRAGDGKGETISFGAAAADIRLAPKDGRLAGALALTVERPAIDAGKADRLDASAVLSMPRTLEGARNGDMFATGSAKLAKASLNRDVRDRMANAVSSPLATLPAFADAAARAVDRAGQDFGVEAPWSLASGESGLKLGVPGMVQLGSSSGLRASLSPKGGDPLLLVDASGDKPSWSSAGELVVSGGGAPSLTLQIDKASGAGSAFTATGSAAVRGWTVGAQSLALDLRSLEASAGDAAGKAGGGIDLSLTGEFAGLDWTRLKARADMNAVWGEQMTVAAAEGVSLAWDAARMEGTSFGAGLLKYAPTGPLAQSGAAGGLKGAGVISRFSVPVEGDGYSARVTAGPSRISWTSGEGTDAAFRIENVAAELIQGEALTPAFIPALTGSLRLRDGWSVNAAFDNAEVRADAVAARELKATLALSGAEGRPMSGSIRDLSLTLFDPDGNGAERLFEPMSFAGSARLVDGDADFSGGFALRSNGVQLGTVSGRHALETAAGSLAFAGAPLVFNPGSLEPSALSPLLRGPANVTGRVDLSGAASWTSGDFNASASANLQDIGFALASAGVFEGVSGRIEVSDLLRGQSPPGQEITIDTVTLGIPFEDGRLRFQLMGYDAVRLESANWPFAGGRLNIRPVDYSIGAGETRFVGEAVDWDLAAIIDRFKIPDLRAEGTVSGEFPIVFSTGSARIDHAVLEASEEGGVIRYGGSTGDAAASADANAKMLFDALKDFRYRVMRVELDGDLAGRMVLKLDLLGSNPAVFYGSAFDIGISIDSPLLNLLNIVNQGQDEVNAIVERVVGAQNGETPQ